MIDFSKIGRSRSKAVPTTLTELFEQLDRKASHNSLRAVQNEALDGLSAQLNEKDLLLKISTGSGKTLVGLAFAEWMRRRYPGEPSLYLCPTNQLVDQVVESAGFIGVAAEAFEGPALRAIAGESVLVCTYDKFFNARNVFASRAIRPSSIVLDDVHAGIDKVRQKHTVRIPPATYARIRQIFHPICESSDPSIWRGIMNNEVHARYDVPFWLWTPNASLVAKLIEPDRESDQVVFEWGNIDRYIEYARLCISGTAAELSLPVVCIEEHAAYSGAKHRLFMSASIKDGSSLIRDLDLDPAALTRITQPPGDRGAGERMILPVSLIDPDLKKAQVAHLCQQLSGTANVVVLTSSIRQADAWVASGAQLRSGAGVDPAIAELKASKRGKYFVFPQRFEGVDLPDDACRVLVIDGTPVGERICDQIDAERLKSSPGFNARTVNRFEQAIGRAVRSSADFAAILLVGHDIAAFIGRKDARDAFEAHTRAQIDLGKEISSQLSDADGSAIESIRKAINVLISRDPQWKETHRDQMATVPKVFRTGATLSSSEEVAIAERRAWLSAKGRRHQQAFDALQGTINSTDIHAIQKAEIMVRASSYVHHVNPGTATSLYQKAFQLNSGYPRPPEQIDKRYERIKQQAANVRDCFSGYSEANAAISRLEEVRASLAFAGEAETVESGLKVVGDMLGASSSRPEKETGRGPDVLWLFEETGFCIEAKSEKESFIFKKDAAQLMLSKDWCRQNTNLEAARIVPVFATNATEAERPEDIGFAPLLLSEQSLFEIINRLRTFLLSISFDGPVFNDTKPVADKLRLARLGADEIQKLLTKPVIKDRK